MKTLFILLIAAAGFTPLQDDVTFRQKHFNTENNLAIEGYDPVSYFSSKPQQGSSSYKYTYKGISYYFINSRNQASFKADPDHYEPVYGGWCAYAMSNGEKVEVDSETYKIVEGKLHLFYNAYFNNTLKKWNENESILKQKADSNWSNSTK